MDYRDIIKAYPTVCRQTEDLKATEPFACFGFECGDGWISLVRELTKQIAELTPHVYYGQVKTKFAGLRAYLSADPEATPEQMEKCHEFVTLAEGKAAKTCEICGEPGTTLLHGGWYVVECRTCTDKWMRSQLKKAQEEMRPYWVALYKTDKGLLVLANSDVSGGRPVPPELTLVSRLENVI